MSSVLKRVRLDLEKDYLLLMGLATFMYAMMMPDSSGWLAAYVKLLSHQTYLLHDFFAVAGSAATFVNAAVHFMIAYYLNVRNNLTHLTGFQLAAVGIFVGHSFFGTHPLNILPIIVGVVCYAHWSGQSFKIYTSQSLFATSMAPVVSYLMFGQTFSWFWCILAILVGLLIGFITPPLAEAFLKFHQGYTLYNIGFTAGIIGLMIYAIGRYLGFEVPNVFELSQQSHGFLCFYLGAMSLSLVIFALLGADLREVRTKIIKLNHRVGRLPDDFVIKYGRRITFLNMGLMGLTYLLLTLVTGLPLNGPTAGALISIIGFSAFGKHWRNTLPIAFGVLLAGGLSQGHLASFSIVLPMLFGTGLAPIAGYYGLLAGLLTGFLHFNVVQSVVGLHMGLSLYNNGFATGFVAAFLIPIFESFKDRPKSKKGKKQ